MWNARQRRAPTTREAGRSARRANHRFPVQPLFKKYFIFPFHANHLHNFRRLTPHEGRFAIVTDAGWDAVDAAASGAREVAGRALPVSDAKARGRPMLIPPAPELRRMGTTPVEGFGDKRSRTVKSCGPDASTPASSWWWPASPTGSVRPFQAASDGDKKARSPGRARNKP